MGYIIRQKTSYVNLIELNVLYFSTGLSIRLDRVLLHVDVFEYGGTRYVTVGQGRRMGFLFSTGA